CRLRRKILKHRLKCCTSADATGGRPAESPSVQWFLGKGATPLPITSSCVGSPRRSRKRCSWRRLAPAAFAAQRERAARMPSEPTSPEHALASLDDVLEFLRGEPDGFPRPHPRGELASAAE